MAFVESFDPASNPDFRTDKPFKLRVVLLNRETVIAEAPPQEFAASHGFCMLGDHHIAVDPSLGFRVETFSPIESFKPENAYATRLKWRDLGGKACNGTLVLGHEISEPKLWIDRFRRRFKYFVRFGYCVCFRRDLY